MFGQETVIVHLLLQQLLHQKQLSLRPLRRLGLPTAAKAASDLAAGVEARHGAAAGAVRGTAIMIATGLDTRSLDRMRRSNEIHNQEACVILRWSTHLRQHMQSNARYIRLLLSTWTIGDKLCLLYTSPSPRD